MTYKQNNNPLTQLMHKNPTESFTYAKHKAQKPTTLKFKRKDRY